MLYYFFGGVSAFRVFDARALNLPLLAPRPRPPRRGRLEATGHRLVRLGFYDFSSKFVAATGAKAQKKVMFECGSFEVEMFLLFCLLAKKPAGLWSDGVGFGIGGVLCAATPAIVNYCVLIIEKI